MEELKEGYYYHIYNRGAGKAQIFWDHHDYVRFIEKYWFYLQFTLETFAYCLLRNHFHFLIRVRTIEEQKDYYQLLTSTHTAGSFFGDKYPETKPYHPSTQLRHHFNSHTRYINKKMKRSGTLVEGTFKRKQIQDDYHLRHMVCYIHRNPIHHKIIRNYSKYPYSSYNCYLSNDSPHLNCKQVLENFGGMSNFIEAHKEFRLNLGEEFYLE